MSPDSISAIPFHEIAGALADSPHGRRMAGGVLACFPEIEHADELSSKCMSPEFAASLLYCEDIGVLSELAAHGLLGESRATYYANMAEGLLGEADWETSSLVNLVLSSPEFKKAPTLRLASPSAVVNNALLANPLVHRDGGFPWSPDDNRMDIFLHNAAVFGNLQNPAIAGFLEEYIKQPYELPKGAPEPEVIMSRILNRKEIPPEIVCAMSSSPKITRDIYRRLVNHPEHRRLVGLGKVNTMRLFDGDTDKAEYVVSPCASSSLVAQAFDKVSGRDIKPSVKNSLILAAQCPRRCYETVKDDDPEFCMSFDFFEQSPWAADGISSKNPSESILQIIEHQKSYLMELYTLSMPFIPFDALDPRKISEGFTSAPVRAGAIIAGACRSRKFATALGDVGDDPNNDIAFLFSPHTSGRKIERLAAIHSELACLAAIHPNGSDIPVESVLPEHREILEAMRDSMAIKGRMVSRTAAAADSLVI